MNTQLSAEKRTIVEAVLSRCREELKDIIGQPVSVIFRLRINSITQEHIVHIVCSEFNITYSQIISEDQTRDVAIPRQILCWMLGIYLGLKSGKIADIVRRERSTVDASIQKVNDMLDIGDSLYVPRIESIEKRVLKLQADEIKA